MKSLQTPVLRDGRRIQTEWPKLFLYLISNCYLINQRIIYRDRWEFARRIFARRRIVGVARAVLFYRTTLYEAVVACRWSYLSWMSLLFLFTKGRLHVDTTLLETRSIFLCRLSSRLNVIPLTPDQCIWNNPVRPAYQRSCPRQRGL